MIDMLMTESGDIALTPNGDIALTTDYGVRTSRVKGQNSYTSKMRYFSQLAYLILMTELGDFLLYPEIGASLELELAGRGNEPATAEYGKQLIRAALTRKNSPITSGMLQIKAVPISPVAIRFDIYLEVDAKTELALSIKQNLDTTFALTQ